MEILLISEYFLMVALVIFLIAGLRLVSYKSVSMGLIGTSSLTLIVSLIIVLFGSIYGISYLKDIALALLFIGIVGTIAFATVLRRAE